MDGALAPAGPQARAERGQRHAAKRSAAALIVPELAKILFDEYARRWMDDRVLKVRAQELYAGLLRNHLLPAFRPSGHRRH